MDSLNELEIQNIRHMCGMSTNLCSKISYYKTLTEDTKVTDIFDKVCNSLTNLKTEISNIL
ncbi:MAG: hypothetical protein RR290_00805 [Clostridia bacterium]